MKRLPRLMFASLVIAFFVYYYMSSRLGGSVVTLDNAVAAYQAGDIPAALKLIEAEPGQYVPLENGCELIISVFAESKRYRLLESVALRCLNANKAIGIAHEGYAKALLEQSRVDEAIKFLEVEIKTQEIGPRVFGALANLYQIKGEYKKAGDQYLAAVEHAADGWTVWMGAALKREQIASDQVFLKSLVHSIAKKASPVEAAEKMLIQVLEREGLLAEIELLKKRY